MTREEAIRILDGLKPNTAIAYGNETAYSIGQALTMAIKALEQEPSGDLISKKSSKNAIYKVCLSEENKDIFVKILDEINKLSSFNPQPCNDAISKQAVLDACEQSINILEAVDRIMDLPPVKQEWTGRWIGHREHCENLGVMPSGLGAYEWCSNCDCGIDVREWHRNNYNYCPNCGARMESEDKE